MNSSPIIDAASQPGIKAIFVDCFDTIISRDVDGQYLKRLWAKRLKIAAGLRLSSEELFDLRVKCEADECSKNNSKFGELEFRYEDLTNQIYKALSAHEGLANRLPSYEFQALSLEIEIALELRHQSLLDDTVQALKKLSHQLPIYLVSDFYHSSRTLRTILAKHNLGTLFKNIFTSSDFLKTKRSSALYTHILKNLALDPSSVLMIGDNPESDIKAAKSVGLATFQTPNHSTKLVASAVTAATVSANLTTSLAKPAAAAPFPELSFSLALFCEALVREASHLKSKKLFFVSREGIFLKKIFDHYQNLLFGKHHFTTTYLRASRKATFLPSLGPLEAESFEVLFRQYRALSLKKFIANLNLSEKLDEELGQIFGPDYLTVHNDLPSSQGFQKLLALKSFQITYEQMRQDQRAALIQYLNELGCTDQDVILVDVGWKGSIQDNLRRIFPSTQRLVGLYLGLSINTSTPESLKRGLLFDSPNLQNKSFCFAKFLPIFEILCAAREGSTSRYIVNNKLASTILSPDPIEEKVYSDIIAPAQAKLFEIFSKSAALLLDHHFDNFSEFLTEIAKHHGRMLYMSTPSEINFLRSINHLENFGPLEHTKFTSPKTSIFKATWNLLATLISPQKTFAANGNPILACDDLGLSWLRIAFGGSVIKNTFGSDAGLNCAHHPCVLSQFLCVLFNLAKRSRTLGDYR